jgi:alkylhydroperoxidase family enzyme
MSWVEHGPVDEGTDNILASHSLNPPVLEAHLQLYRRIMFGPSGLSRLEREAMAVSVSAANACHY